MEESQSMDVQSGSGAAAASFRTQAWMMAAIAVIAALPFLRCLNYPFLDMWDDAMISDKGELLTFSLKNILYWCQGNYDGQIVPATFLTFMLDYALSGTSPVGYHLQNILWHCVVCAGVFKCFTLFNVRPWTAFVFALVFATHPQRVESVAWISERKDVIFAAFATWSFYFYAKEEKSDRLFRPLPLALYTLALLSKPTAATMPLVLFAFELSRRPLKPLRVALRILPFLLLAVAMFLAVCGKPPEWEYSYPMKLFVSVRNLAWYLKSSILPWDLLPLYPRVAFDAASILFVSASALLGLGAAFLLHRAGLLIRNAIPLALCFAGALAPTVGFLQFSNADYADRYSYLPSAFVFFACAWLLSRALDWAEKEQSLTPINEALRSLLLKKGLLGMLGALLVAAMALSSFNYIQTYSSEMALLTTATDIESPNPEALCLLALKKTDLGIPAVGEFMDRMKKLGYGSQPKPLGTGKEFSSYDILCWYLKASDMAIEPGGLPKAIAILSEIKKRVPSGKRAHINKQNILSRLAIYQLQLGQKSEAIATLGEMAAGGESQPLKENGAKSLFTIGVKAFLEQDFVKAEAFFERAAALDPASPIIRHNLEQAKAKAAEEEGKPRKEHPPKQQN